MLTLKIYNSMKIIHSHIKEFIIKYPLFNKKIDPTDHIYRISYGSHLDNQSYKYAYKV